MSLYETLERRAGLGATQGDKGGPRTTTSSSVSAMVSSVAVNGLVFLVLLIVFLLLRNFFKRVYTPRSFVGSVPKQKRVEEAPPGFFAVIKKVTSRR